MNATRLVRGLGLAARLLAAMLLVLLAGLPSGRTVAADRTPETLSTHPDYATGEILVAFEPNDISAQSAGTLLSRYEAAPIRTLYGSDVQLVRVPDGQEVATSRALGAEPGIRYAEPNYIYRAQGIPNDPGYGAQWAYPTIGAPAAWDISTGSSAITIAIVDTGIDASHPDLATKLVPGWDFISDDSVPNDENGHGTHVAGIAAAATNNGVGVAGMAWGARIMPVRALDTAGNGTAADVASAINYAWANGAKIINLSLGGPQGSSTLQGAINSAYAAGALVVAAMGNEGTNTPFYPAANAHVLAVAATDQYDVRASYSNFGTHCDIAAPGGLTYCHGNSGIYSTLPTYDVWLTLPNTTGCIYYKTYDTMQGTSQATPFVSGLAALIWSVDPTLTSDQVQQTMQNTAVDLGVAGPDIYYGYGRINALAALESLITLATPTLAAISNADNNGDYTIDWSDVQYATSYELQEDDNAAFTTPTTVYTGTKSQSVVTSHIAGRWYYRVRAVRSSSAKVSAWSTSQSVGIIPNSPVLLPINNNGADSYPVVWQSVPGATGYLLQVSTFVNFAVVTSTNVGPSLSFNVVSQPGGTWYYRVQAYNAVGTGPWSVVQSTTVIPAPPVLGPIAETIEPDAYTLNWTEATGATAYRLEEADTAAFTTPVTRYLGSLTSYTITGQSGGEWYYRVRAANAAGESPPSSTRSFTVTVPSIPAPILQPIVGVGSGTAYTYTLAWTSVLTATGYLAEMSGSPYFVGATLYYSGTLTQTTVVDHLSGPRYYRVRAQTDAGKSPWSNTESFAIPAYVYLPMIVRSTMPALAGVSSDRSRALLVERGVQPRLGTETVAEAKQDLETILAFLPNDPAPDR